MVGNEASVVTNDWALLSMAMRPVAGLTVKSPRAMGNGTLSRAGFANLATLAVVDARSSTVPSIVMVLAS